MIIFYHKNGKQNFYRKKLKIKSKEKKVTEEKLKHNIQLINNQ